MAATKGKIKLDSTYQTETLQMNKTAKGKKKYTKKDDRMVLQLLMRCKQTTLPICSYNTSLFSK